MTTNSDCIKSILIVGLGSMGKRRARLIKNINNNIKISGVDNNLQRRQQASDLNITAYESIAKATVNENYDAAFVCTAPISHSTIINELLNANLNVFTELNLVDTGYEELIEKAKNKNLKLFLSNTMLYRKEIEYIKNNVQEFEKPVNYIYHIGQYLPDWHPWESYKNFFVGNKQTSGIREILGIDLPWLWETFGEVVSVSAQSDKLTDLEIEYDDSLYVTLRHKNGTKGFIAADVVSPKAVRNFEVFAQGLHIFWNGNPKSLYKYNTNTKENEQIDTYKIYEQDNRYSETIVENAYVDEILCFFNYLQNKQMPLWTFEKDKQVIELMNKIDETALKAKGDS